jgi:hypothetical protein
VSQSTSDAYHKGLFARLAGEPDDVARTIERALSVERPRARYPVTASARLFLTLRAVLPDRTWDAMLGAQFPKPSREALRLSTPSHLNAARPDSSTSAQSGSQG